MAGAPTRMMCLLQSRWADNATGSQALQLLASGGGECMPMACAHDEMLCPCNAQIHLNRASHAARLPGQQNCIVWAVAMLHCAQAHLETETSLTSSGTISHRQPIHCSYVTLNAPVCSSPLPSVDKPVTTDEVHTGRSENRRSAAFCAAALPLRLNFWVSCL